MREELIRDIQIVLTANRPDQLEQLYQAADRNAELSRLLVMQLWYDAKHLHECTDEQLRAIANALGLYAPDTEEATARRLYREVLAESGVRSDLINFDSICRCAARHKDELGGLEHMSGIQVARLMDYMDTISCEMIRRYVVVLSTYGKWLALRGYKFGVGLTETNSAEIARSADLTTGMKRRLVRDPAMLSNKITQYFKLDTGNCGPIALVLAWMRFPLAEMVEIRTEEVDEANHVICGKYVPDELWDIVEQYIYVTQKLETIVIDIGGRLRTLNFKNNGRLLRSTTSHEQMRVSSMVQRAAGDGIIALSDVTLSAKFYELYKIEQAGELTHQSIIDVFEVPPNKNALSTRLRNLTHEYVSFKKTFSLE